MITAVIAPRKVKTNFSPKVLINELIGEERQILECFSLILN